MSKHAQTIDPTAALFDSEVGDAIQDAAAKVLAEQGFFARRKNTFAAAGNLILQVVNAAAFAGHEDWRIAAAVAAVIFVAEIVVHAATKGSVTPSGIAAITAAVEPRNVEHAPRDASGLTIYEGDMALTSGPDADPDHDPFIDPLTNACGCPAEH